MFLALGPLVQAVILDDAVLADQRPLAPWIALLIAVGVVSFVANYGRRRLGGRAAVDVQRDLQVAVHHHMQYLDPARRDQLRAGDIMSRATSDITLIQVFLQQLAMSIGVVRCRPCQAATPFTSITCRLPSAPGITSTPA